MGVIYITHRLEELRAIGDRVTVLRDGETVHTGDLADIATEQLIRHMVGREVAAIYRAGTSGRRRAAAGSARPDRERRGCRHLAHSARGRDHRDGGIDRRGTNGIVPRDLRRRPRRFRARCSIDGTAAADRLAARRGESRHRAGDGRPPDHPDSPLRLPIAANMTMANVERISRCGFLDLTSAESGGIGIRPKLRLKAASPSQLAGNVERRQSAESRDREMAVPPGARISFDEPTRGIDVGAKAEVFELMIELRAIGAAILMVSSEMPDCFSVADRILVMRQGRIAGELPGAPLSRKS